MVLLNKKLVSDGIVKQETSLRWYCYHICNLAQVS